MQMPWNILALLLRSKEKVKTIVLKEGVYDETFDVKCPKQKSLRDD